MNEIVVRSDVSMWDEAVEAQRSARKTAEMNQKKKTGKGVAALTEVPGGLKMDPRNVKRREKHAAKVAERAVAARKAASGMMPDRPMGPVLDEPGRTYERIDPKTVRMTFTGTVKPTDEGAKALREAIDAPAPVRLSVTTLASAFAEACAKVKEADAALAVALGARMRAKAALDGEISRLANEVG